MQFNRKLLTILILLLVLFFTLWQIKEKHQNFSTASIDNIIIPERKDLISDSAKSENISFYDCPTKTEERIVRGNSLSGLIEPGQTIEILLGYYDCNIVKRGDIVVYNYAGDINPIIKVVKAISGDSFQMKKAGVGWNILINNEIVKNSQNQPYIIDESGYKMLSLYINDYKGVIPENAYLILGNLTGGSLDSTRFGLIDKSDILGKVNY
jgi:signal peptidase I